jgi:hypothetical protein
MIFTKELTFRFQPKLKTSSAHTAMKEPSRQMPPFTPICEVALKISFKIRMKNILRGKQALKRLKLK